MNEIGFVVKFQELLVNSCVKVCELNMDCFVKFVKVYLDGFVQNGDVVNYFLQFFGKDEKVFCSVRSVEFIGKFLNV